MAASATVPYVSRPVVIRRIPYLDGGCTDRIPYQWALDEGYEKIVVVRTRDRNYRKSVKDGHLANAVFYRSYPMLRKALDDSAKNITHALMLWTGMKQPERSLSRRRSAR